METPDVTKAQIVSVVMWGVSLLTLLGFKVSDATANATTAVVFGFFTIVLPTVLVIADSVIRRARANNIKAIQDSRPAGSAYVG